jgi:hypothetical protein
MAGAPKGNQNAAGKHVSLKPWDRALRNALAHDESQPEQKQLLRRAAKALLTAAAAGDIAALKELGDRLDGKVAQVIAGDGDAPLRVVLTRDDSDL